MYLSESNCTLLSQLYPLKFDKLASVSLVRIYHAGFDRKCGWKYTGLKGTLFFGEQKHLGVTDADSTMFSFHLFDMADKLLWKCSVPATIEYYRDPPFFHVFRGLSRMWGFVIEHDDESSCFYEEVIRRTRGRAVARRPTSSRRRLNPRSL